MSDDEDATELDQKVCGNCRAFADEDVNGEGWCEAHRVFMPCSQTCEDWQPKQ